MSRLYNHGDPDQSRRLNRAHVGHRGSGACVRERREACVGGARRAVLGGGQGDTPSRSIRDGRTRIDGTADRWRAGEPRSALTQQIKTCAARGLVTSDYWSPACLLRAMRAGLLRNEVTALASRVTSAVDSSLALRPSETKPDRRSWTTFFHPPGTRSIVHTCSVVIEAALVVLSRMGGSGPGSRMV